MKPEFGKLKIYLVTIIGVVTPLTLASDIALPPVVALVAACVLGGAINLYNYLIKPPQEDIFDNENKK